MFIVVLVAIVIVTWGVVAVDEYLDTEPFLGEFSFAETVFLGISTTAIALIVFLFWRANRNIKEDRKDHNLAISMEVTEQHIDVLKRKKKQLLDVDDYGNVDASRWAQELYNFFSKMVVEKDHLFGELSDDELSNILSTLDQHITHYESEAAEDIRDAESLGGIEYEHYCADLFKSSGWTTRVMKASGDQGVDLIAELSGVTLAVQCKKYSKPVGNKAVQEVVAGKSFYGADHAAVVTNSTYTRSAKELARLSSVLLIHHSEIPKVISQLIAIGPSNESS